MVEYINREELLKDINDSVVFSTRNGVSAELRGAHKIVDRIFSAPSADVVLKAVSEQVKWERDTALATLKEHGIGLAEKADVVEVVRCSKCQHWGGVTFGFICRKFSGENTKICMHADDFCSYGERRSENENT